MNRDTVRSAVLEAAADWLAIDSKRVREGAKWEDLGVRVPDSLDNLEFCLSLETSLGLTESDFREKIRDPQSFKNLTIDDTIDDICQVLNVTPN